MNQNYIVFPTFLGNMTGVQYLRVGARKVWITLINDHTLGVPRKKFPEVLPEGSELAFLAAKIALGGAK